MKQDDLEEIMVKHVAANLNIGEGDVDPDVPLSEFGLDSMGMLTLGETLQAKLGFEVEPTLLWYHPTISKLAQHLAETFASNN